MRRQMLDEDKRHAGGFPLGQSRKKLLKGKQAPRGSPHANYRRTARGVVVRPVVREL